MISYLDEEILVSFEGWFGNMFDVLFSLLHMFDLCGYHKEELALLSFSTSLKLHGIVYVYMYIYVRVLRACDPLSCVLRLVAVE